MEEVDPLQQKDLDFEESLVQSVIAENPPDEQGIREEWQEQTGWHRKEDIYSGLRRPNHIAANNIKESQSQTQNVINNKQPSTLRISYSWAIFFLLVMLVVFIILDHIKRRKLKEIVFIKRDFKHNMIKHKIRL